MKKVIIAISLVAVLVSTVEAGNCSIASYGLDVTSPGASCGDIYEKNPSSHGKSGQYLIKTDKLFLAYCDMEEWKGWMKIADVDTSNGSQGQCPGEWRMLMVNGVKVCRAPNDAAGCYSTFFSVNGLSYRKIRGLVRGYQKSTTDSFDSRRGIRSIDTTYVDGVSITLGNPRKHVWTYVAGYSDHGNVPALNCPCAAVPGPSPPSFVGEHYYCESGDNGRGGKIGFITSDPLWDGAGCVNAKNNCCNIVGLPWFIRKFSQYQNDNIEVRICYDEDYSNEAVLVDKVLLYIK